MRPIRNYTLRDWRKLKPLEQLFRRGRNLAIEAVHQRRKAEGQEAFIEGLRERLKGRTMAATIAFNTPDVIGWLIDGMARHVPGAQLVVFDNSNDPGRAAEIAALCRAAAVPYLPLPRTPLKLAWNGSRSHGMALNWVYRNIIVKVEPKVFALLDHDLIPTAPVSLEDLVAKQPFYGQIRGRHHPGHGWYLWPGYSIFDFRKVSNVPLDFGTDVPLRLDTGGQNWHVLFRNYDPSGMNFAYRREEPFTAIDGMPDLDMVDDWWHVRGAAYKEDAKARRAVGETIIGHLEARAADAARRRNVTPAV